MNIYLHIIILFISALTVNASSSDGLSLISHLTDSNDTHSIEFTLTNNTNEDIYLLRESLPWNSTYSSSLILIPFDTRFPHALYTPEGGMPTGDIIKVESKSSISGTLPINRYFRNLDEIIKNKNAVIFWWCEFSGVTPAVHNQLFFGHFLLEAKRSRNRP